MKQLTIYLNSDVANIATNIPSFKFSELEKLARKETVEIIFFKDYCRVIGKKNRKVKVPNKITKSTDELLKWIENKITTAWGQYLSMKKKTEIAVNLLRAGNFIKALSIIKTFRFGFTKDEKRSIEIAYESLLGRDKFYQSIGIDTNKEIEKASQLLSDKYL